MGPVDSGVDSILTFCGPSRHSAVHFDTVHRDILRSIATLCGPYQPVRGRPPRQLRSSCDASIVCLNSLCAHALAWSGIFFSFFFFLFFLTLHRLSGTISVAKLDHEIF